MNLQTAKTSELVEFYNKNVPEDKRIKKFRDRATAEKRCRALITPVPTTVPVKSKEELDESKKTLKKRVGAVGHTIRNGILNGKTAKEIVTEIREKHPNSKSTEKEVAWWRFELRKQGKEIPASHYVRQPKSK